MKVTTSQRSMARPIPDREAVGREMANKLAVYLGPLLRLLDEQLDRRLVDTFAATVANILRHRGRDLCLLLTELGELLTDGAHAPAGVKRLWRLLRSPKWTSRLVDEWVLAGADRAVEEIASREGIALVVLDGSEIEKPFARKLEGLTKVRSAQASFLQRASGGPPPKIPVIVPGFGWVAAVVTGWTGSFTLARLHWYSPKAPGEAAEQQREAELAVLLPLLTRWGRKVLLVLDRGYDGREFLGQLLAQASRLIVRWRGDYHLIGPDGQEQSAGQITRYVRSQWHFKAPEPRTHQPVRLGVASVPVSLVGSSIPLWLVVLRRRGKKSIWLLTTEEARLSFQAIGIVRTYTRRWQVEWAFRYDKSELGLASIRVRLWEYRQKLWAIAVLVHAFLLQLLVLDQEDLLRVLRWCHRTGRKWQHVIAPLYRLRHALANIWKDPPMPTPSEFGM